MIASLRWEITAYGENFSGAVLVQSEPDASKVYPPLGSLKHQVLTEQEQHLRILNHMPVISHLKEAIMIFSAVPSVSGWNQCVKCVCTSFQSPGLESYCY